MGCLRLWQVLFEVGHTIASGQGLQKGLQVCPQNWMRGPAQVAKQWKVPVLGVNCSYHSQTMLPVVWKKKLL